MLKKSKIMLKNKNIKFMKLTIFEILREIFVRKKTIIIIIANVFFNYLNFFNKAIKAYSELKSI